MSQATRRFSVLSPLFLTILFASQVHAQCPICPTGSTLAFINFTSFSAGAPVEGLGTVHPNLNITSVPWSFAPSCSTGAAVIEDGNPVPYASYASPASNPNGCLTALKGFGDEPGCVLDYDFTFAPGVTVNCFSFRMLDYGDFFPFGGATHQVDVTAYDAANNIVDTDQLVTVGGELLASGDACGASHNGDPGNKLFTVTGAGIVKVTLRFDGFPDPNVGYDDISFCQSIQATPSIPNSWGRLKSIYR